MQLLRIRPTVLLVACAAMLATASCHASPQDRLFQVEVHGSGYPMILIPGLASSGHVWDSTVAHYSDRYECHVLTLAGFAGVPRVETDSFMATARDQIADYIRDNHLGQPIIVGHSLGGVLALWIAETHPDVVGQLVIVDALPYLVAATDSNATAESMQTKAGRMRDMIESQPPLLFRSGQPSNYRGLVSDSANVALAASWAAASDQNTVAQASYELLTTDLRAGVASIHVPVLVLVAGDGMAPRLNVEETEQIFRRQYQGLDSLRMVTMEGSRHYIMLDDPTGFLEEMDSFLGWK